MDGKYITNSLYRGIKLLEILAEKSPVNLDNLSKISNIPKATVYRLLDTFNTLGYVRIVNNDEKIARYELDLKILTLSKAVLAKLDARAKLGDILMKLSDETMETSQLCMYYNKKVLYIYDVKKPRILIYYAEVGSELPLNLCAPGLVFSAHFDDKELESILGTMKFEKKTDHSIKNIQEFKKKIEVVKSTGYAFDDQFYAIGLRCIAAPVFNHDGKQIYALNITGHLSTMSDERIGELANTVKAMAEQASKRLGYGT